MSRETIFQHWCDLCLRLQDQKVPATFTEPVSVGKVRRHLDLCTDHEAKVIGDLPDILEVYGNPVEAAANGVADVHKTCPVCGEVFSIRQSMTAHVRHAHNQSISDFPGTARRTDQPATCPECGHVAKAPAGLSAHRKAKHGVEGSSASTLWNRRNRGK